MVSTILAVAAGLLGMVMPAQAGSLAAFYTPPLSGAQVIYQNSTTGDITHSLCTSIGEPIFPMDSPKAFQLPYTAKNGTSLTATGWWDGSTVWAVIIYQSVNNDIVQATYKCDQKTGTYTTVDSFLINGVKNSPTIHPNTGLSINLLGAAAGEHLYFHDTKKAVHAFYFTTDSGWTYGSKVSPDNNLSGMGLTSSFFGANETVFVPKDNKNVEMAVWNTDATWHISTFPQPLKEAYDNKDNNTNPALGTAASNAITLPAWDGTTNSLASSIDKDNTKYLFYIGTDKKLHLVTSALNSGQPQPFIVRTEKGPEFWPVADKANADLGIAFNPASYDVTLFYFSNGGIVAVNQTGKIDAWNTAYTLPQVNTTVEDTGSSGGLSTGAKAGLGVGVSVGVILIVAALAFFYVRRQRQKRLAQAPSENPEMAMGPDGQMIHPGHLSAQMTGQPPYDYTQVQQYDYNQQNYGQQWAADNKKAFSPDPTYGQMQHSMGVEMPDSSPAPHRLSELPANYNSLSHELPAADVDRIQAASPEPQSAYTPAISQPSEYGTAAEPGSPHQRAPSAVSWTAVSPPPTYVSQSTSPAPSAAYGQSQYMQPISPQVTGDYQFQQQPQQAYVQQGQAQVTQSPQMQRESLGAISEQHESTNVHYQHQQQQQQYEQYQQQPQQQQQYEQYQQQPQQQQYEQYQQQQQYEQYQQQQQQQQQQPQQQQQHPQQHPQQHQ